MKPNAVLDESQYQRRFRKMIRKQQEEIFDSQVGESSSIGKVRWKKAAVLAMAYTQWLYVR